MVIPDSLQVKHLFLVQPQTFSLLCEHDYKSICRICVVCRMFIIGNFNMSFFSFFFSMGGGNVMLQNKCKQNLVIHDLFIISKLRYAVQPEHSHHYFKKL